MTRPLYCPCEDDEPQTCPECGATVEGKDPVRGICQAVRSGPRPRPLVEIILVRKDTGLPI